MSWVAHSSSLFRFSGNSPFSNYNRSYISTFGPWLPAHDYSGQYKCTVKWHCEQNSTKKLTKFGSSDTFILRKLTLVHIQRCIFRVGWEGGDVGGRGAWWGGRGRWGQWCGGGVALRSAAAALQRDWSPVTVWNLKELMGWGKKTKTSA